MFVFRRRPDKRDLDLSDMISARIDFLAVFRHRPDKRDLDLQYFPSKSAALKESLDVDLIKGI